MDLTWNSHIVESFSQAQNIGELFISYFVIKFPNVPMNILVSIKAWFMVIEIKSLIFGILLDQKSAQLIIRKN